MLYHVITLMLTKRSDFIYSFDKHYRNKIHSSGSAFIFTKNRQASINWMRVANHSPQIKPNLKDI